MSVATEEKVVKRIFQLSNKMWVEYELKVRWHMNAILYNPGAFRARAGV